MSELESKLSMTCGETEDQSTEGKVQSGQAWPKHTVGAHLMTASLNLKGRMISSHAGSTVRDVGLFFEISSPITEGRTQIPQSRSPEPGPSQRSRLHLQIHQPQQREHKVSVPPVSQG